MRSKGEEVAKSHKLQSVRVVVEQTIADLKLEGPLQQNEREPKKNAWTRKSSEFSAVRKAGFDVAQSYPGVLSLSHQQQFSIPTISNSRGRRRTKLANKASTASLSENRARISADTVVIALKLVQVSSANLRIQHCIMPAYPTTHP